MLLSIIAAFLTLTNPQAKNCATIDNHKNLATWTERDGTEYHRYWTHYKDNGDHLIFGTTKHLPKQVYQAEAALQPGKPGHKIITVCS